MNASNSQLAQIPHTHAHGAQHTWAMAHALLAVVLFSLTAPLTQIALSAFSAEFIALCAQHWQGWAA